MPIKIFLRCPRPAGNFTLLVSFFPRLEHNAPTPRNNCSLKFIIFPTLNLVNFHEYRIFFTRNEYRRLEAIISNKILQRKKVARSSSNEDNNNAKQ